MTTRRVRFLFTWCALTASAGAGDAAPAAPSAPDRDAVLQAAARDEAIVQLGRETFGSLCQACHGDASAQGEAVSNLFDAKWHHGSRPSEIERTILRGVLDRGMPGWGEILAAEDTTALTAFLLRSQQRD